MGPLILGDQIRRVVSSFVRSVTMDKWKDIELEKMKAGGNAKFREFLEAQEDYEPNWSLQDKYSSRAAALFRDKVRIELACFIHRGECLAHTSTVARCGFSGLGRQASFVTLNICGDHALSKKRQG